METLKALEFLLEDRARNGDNRAVAEAGGHLERVRALQKALERPLAPAEPGATTTAGRSESGEPSETDPAPEQ